VESVESVDGKLVSHQITQIFTDRTIDLEMQ
jgi:hypothetical protein